MNNRKARAIRRALALPRLPKTMSSADRAFYRAVKARYDALPAGPAREVFLDNITALKTAVRDTQARTVAAYSRTGQRRSATTSV